MMEWRSRILLFGQADIVSAQGVRKYLRDEIQNMEICMMDTVSSSMLSSRIKQPWKSRKAIGSLPMDRPPVTKEQAAAFSFKDTGTYLRLHLRAKTALLDRPSELPQWLPLHHEVMVEHPDSMRDRYSSGEIHLCL